MVNDGKLNSIASEVIIRIKRIYPRLNLTSNVNNSATPVSLNYKLFIKEENSFIQKIDTFATTGDTIHLSVEPGDWIVLVSPASDPSAFVPTYAGNVLDWNEAEILTIPDKSITFREITCIMPEIAITGVGQISGFVYEDPGSGTKSISISRINSTFSNPIQNALVSLYRKGSTIPVYSVFTDSQGAYKFDKLELIDYEIVVEIPGFIQSDKFTIVLSTIEPVTNAYFSVDTSSQVITDNHSVKVSFIKVYPNPTNGIVHISGLPEKIENTISVFTIEGKQVMEKKTGSIIETIDISNQTPGTYIVMVNKERFKILKK